MDYSRVYSDFIADRRTKEDSLARFERHHIVPRCRDGRDEPENLIKLALQDHLFAHLLLAKIHGGVLATCFVRMLGYKKYAGKRSRRRFETLREAARRNVVERNTGWRPTDEQRARHAATYTPEKRAAIGEFHSKRIVAEVEAGTYDPPALGMVHTKETKDVLSAKSRVNALAQWQDPIQREAITSANQKTWSDPAKLAEHSARMTEVFKSSDLRAKLSERAKKMWADPAKRDELIEALRLGRERKKERLDG